MKHTFKFEPKLIRTWSFPFGLFLLCFALALLSSSGRETFSYSYSAVEMGQVWRMITGHLTHLGWSHFWLNLSGFLGIWSLYGNKLKTSEWISISLASVAFISLGLFILNPQIQSYVGLSGMLHALMAAAAMRSLLRGWQDDVDLTRLEDSIILIGLSAKIIFEQFIGAVPMTEKLSGGAVVLDAHFYGFTFGIVFGAFGMFSIQKLRPITLNRNHCCELSTPNP